MFFWVCTAFEAFGMIKALVSWIAFCVELLLSCSEFGHGSAAMELLRCGMVGWQLRLCRCSCSPSGLAVIWFLFRSGVFVQ